MTTVWLGQPYPGSTAIEKGDEREYVRYPLRFDPVSATVRLLGVRGRRVGARALGLPVRQPLMRSWFSHAELTSGGELVLKMGPEPNLAWGNRPEDRPPTIVPEK